MTSKASRRSRGYKGLPRLSAPGGTPPLDAGAYAGKFSGKYAHRLITGGVGHNLPQEAPEAFAQAILDVGHI